MARLFSNTISALFLLMILVSLSGCDVIKNLIDINTEPKPVNIVVNRSQPKRVDTDIEPISLPNCNAPGSLEIVLGSEAAVRRGTTIRNSYSAGGSSTVNIPQVAEILLKSEVQRAYQDSYDNAVKYLDSIKMEAPAGTSVLYDIVWQEVIYDSTVEFTLDGEDMEADYTFVMTVPRVRDSHNVSCENTSTAVDSNPPSDLNTGKASHFITNDQLIKVDEELLSANGKYRLLMQSDGNLVIYRLPDDVPLWASDTSNQDADYVYLQTDGKLVLFAKDGSVLWESNSALKEIPEGYHLIMQDDGNLVIYEQAGGDPIWASGTAE